LSLRAKKNINLGPKHLLTPTSGNFSVGRPRFPCSNAPPLLCSPQRHALLPPLSRSPPALAAFDSRRPRIDQHCPRLQFSSPSSSGHLHWSPRMKHVTAQVGKASNRCRNCAPQKIARQVPAFQDT
jgi:hypothetical protein